MSTNEKFDDLQIDFFQKYSKTAELHTVVIIILSIILLQVDTGIKYNFTYIILLVIASTAFTFLWHHFLIHRTPKKYINLVELAFHIISINILIQLTGAANSIFLFYAILPVYRLMGINKIPQNLLIVGFIEAILIVFLLQDPQILTLAKVLPEMVGILILDSALLSQGKIIRDLDVSYAKEQAKIDELTEVNKYKDEFIYLASHELRTPIAIIRGYLDLFVHEKTNKISEKGQDILRNLQDGIDNLAQIIDSLLNISRLERGKVVINKEEVNISKLIENITNELNINAQKKDIELKNECAIPSSTIIYSDSLRLREIFVNLIDNAIKYTKAGGQVKVDTLIEKNSLEISVIDNGIGIPEKEQSKIFQKFYRATNANITINKGTGLGLYTVYKIVELLKGNIQFISKENKGTTFKVNLPIS